MQRFSHIIVGSCCPSTLGDAHAPPLGGGYGFTFAPHFSQNFAPGVNGAPQLVQKRFTISVTGSAGRWAGTRAGTGAGDATPTAACEPSNDTTVVPPPLI